MSTISLKPDLPPDLILWQKEWEAEQTPSGRERIFSDERGNKFAQEIFRNKELEGFEGRQRPQYLLSILGLQWQPVALIAAWAQPKSHLIIGTSKSLSTKKLDEIEISPLEQILRTSGLRAGAINTREVPDDGEAEIYGHVREFVLKLIKDGVDPRDIGIDATGGMKSMSAAAALAGFVLGCTLLYVDSRHRTSPTLGPPIPIAGTEFPRLLRNPLEETGQLEYERIFQAVNSGSLTEAANLARTLEKKLYESKPAEFLGLFSEAYQSWHEFRLSDAEFKLKQAISLAESCISRWQWLSINNINQMKRNLAFILELLDLENIIKSRTELNCEHLLHYGPYLICNHLSMADRASAENRVSLGALLYYATIEKTSDLVLRARHGLDDEKPDYSQASVDMKIYHDIGRKLIGEGYEERALDGSISFVKGIQLAISLEDSFMYRENAKFMKNIGYFSKLMQTRNRSEYEHGLFPAHHVKKVEAEIKNYRGLAMSYAAICLYGSLDEGYSQISRALSMTERPKLAWS